MKSISCLVAFASVFLPLSALDAFEGFATVIEADVIEVDGRQIHLFGAGAPGLEHTCRGAEAEWRCGQAAAMALQTEIGHNPVSCVLEESDGDGVTQAICSVGPIKLNTWLLAHGWALAGTSAPSTYHALERAAAAAQTGIWRDGFIPPSYWRDRASGFPGDTGCSSCTLRHQSFHGSE